VLADDREHAFGVGGGFERLAEFGLVQQLRDVGERVEMLLKLSLRHQEEHDQVHRLVVQRVEVHPGLRTAERPNDLGDQLGGGVRDADAKPDARAHGGLALLYHGGDGVLVLRFDFSGGDEVVDQLVDGQPAVRRLQIGDDLLFR